jgi:hypothetical protein
MPSAIAPLAMLGAGAGSAAGGKKGNKSAQKAADAQFQMQQQLLSTGLSAFNPAADYFKKLLSGDPTQIAAAVGPTSDILKGQAQSQSRQLAATMPAGGGANAAQAANAQNSYNSLARLYAGVQPGAATALGQLASTPLGLSAPNVGSGMKFDTHQQEQQTGAKSSLGQGIGGLGAGIKQNGWHNTMKGPGKQRGSSPAAPPIPA